MSKFHVLDLLQNFDCGNAVKKWKLNWQAVTLGIQRQFKVVDTASCRNPKLVEVLDILVPAHHWVAIIPDNDVADPH